MKLTKLIAIRGVVTALGVLPASAVPARAQDTGPENAANAAEAAQFVGHWSGVIEARGPEGVLALRLRLHVVESDGGLSSTMTSVDQGNAQVPVETTEADGATLRLVMPAIGGSFEGTLSEDGTSIDGTFTQMGSAMPLRLERIDPADAEAEAPARRPQDPEEPLPYHAEDVTFSNPKGGHTLAGTFTRPESGGPFPAVILISGSGPQDRNEEMLGHRPFLVLSDFLTRAGIAVLRYDDRGVGESTGDFAAATTADLATDASAGVAYLKTRDDVRPDKIGLAGHSEGGLIAPIVAAGSSDVAYIVLMAGPGVNGERILRTQVELIGKANGASDEAVAKLQRQQRAIFSVLLEDEDISQALPRVAALVRAQIEEATDDERALIGVTDETSLESTAAAQAAQVSTPWFRYFLRHEPAEVLERVTVPVLAINGERDLQVPFEENLREIEAAFQRAGNTRYEVHALPGHNHLFQRAETGSPNEYQAIEETWSTESMQLIADWILKTVQGEPQS